MTDPNRCPLRYDDYCEKCAREAPYPEGFREAEEEHCAFLEDGE